MSRNVKLVKIFHAAAKVNKEVDAAALMHTFENIV